jgi:hypothetical protein
MPRATLSDLSKEIRSPATCLLKVCFVVKKDRKGDDEGKTGKTGNSSMAITIRGLQLHYVTVVIICVILYICDVL